MYDGCSDEEFKEGEIILQIYPPDDNALSEIKKFISDHALTNEDVKITKNKYGITLTAKTLLVLAILHEGRSVLSSTI